MGAVQAAALDGLRTEQVERAQHTEARRVTAVEEEEEEEVATRAAGVTRTR